MMYVQLYVLHVVSEDEARNWCMVPMVYEHRQEAGLSRQRERKLASAVGSNGERTHL